MNYLFLLIIIIIILLNCQSRKYDMFGNLLTDEQLKSIEKSGYNFNRQASDVIFYNKKKKEYPNKQKLFARLLYDVRQGWKCKRYGLCGEIPSNTNIITS